MSQMTRFAPTGGILMTLCAAFAGCAARTDVSATGSTPAQFTHVFITAQSVWFNKNAGATADDAGWTKYDLKTPVTVDLVAQSNGTLAEIASDLRPGPGTYNSILLVPVNPDPNVTPLTASAQALGATSNQEADFTDGSGSHQVPLILPNWEKGIVVQGSVKVPVGSVSSTGIGTTTTTPGTTNSASTLFGSPTTVNPTTPTTTTGTSNNTVTASFAANFDGNRDLHAFSYPSGSSASQTGVLLSASPAASDLSTSGGITGTLSLTTITNLSTNPSIANAFSGRTAIWASAESLSADGSHHVIVASAPVGSDGTFTIYPLPSNSRTPTVYDVVIHGPNIQTIIIKSISVATTTPNFQFGANTAGSVNTTTASGAVSLGTITPTPTPSYTVNLPSNVGTPSPLPGGAALTFYQTLPAANEVPYAIDEVGIDPVNQVLVTPEALSTNVSSTTGAPGIVSGIYSTNGGTITLTTSMPVEGKGVYEVGATAPLYADSIPSDSLKVGPPAPPSSSSTGTTTPPPPLLVPVPTLTPANAGASGSITVSVTNNQGNDRGTLLVSHAGAVVGTADLKSALANGSGPVTVSGLPSSNVYYLSVILWSSTQPPNTPVTYESIATPVNLSGSTANTSIAIN
jgi:Domain of unknown function (DUF4382)